MLNGKHYNAVNGGYTRWTYKNGVITLDDGASKYKILHFVKGIDGNEHRVFWEASTLEEAISYLDRNAE
jgi:hypothetical protein